MKSLVENIMERGTKFLNDPEIQARMDDQTKADLAKGKLEVYYADYYMRKKFTSVGGQIDIIKEVDDRKIGVTNLDKGKLPSGNYMAVCAVGMGYAYAAATTDIPSEVRYASSEYLNTIPTKLMNSEFTLVNGDKVIIRTRTKAFFANAYADFAGDTNDENVVMLPSPKLATYKNRFKAQFDFAEDNAAMTMSGSNSHYVELRILGVAIGERTN